MPIIKYLVLSYLLFSSVFATAQKFQGLAKTPPMGWNSWNRFQCDGINEKVIRQASDALVSSGLKDAGYEYITIDDCWQIDRDKEGNIIPDPKKFPSGIKALADYIHSKGLKFGIYSCAGSETCAKRPGSRGYEFQDARQYAAWGVDYLKLDWCNTGTQNAQASYTLVRDAIYKAGRPMVFSMCEWGLSKPWSWASDVGHLWRTTGDITNTWSVPDAKEGKVWGGGVIIILDMQQGLEKYAGPDHWNDMDMLEVGNGALTEEESRAHFSLWCMLASPLMAGNDLGNMTQPTLQILTNKEAIALDQDPLGRQGYKIKDEGEFEIFMKPLYNGDTAICLFNRNNKPLEVEVNWNELKLSDDLLIRDLWKHKQTGTTATTYKAVIKSHDVVLLRLTKKR
jgi:alpha-galactosidase